MALVSSGLPTNLGDMVSTRKEGLRLDVLGRDDKGRLHVSVYDVRTGETLEGYLDRQVREPNNETAGLLSVGAWGCPKTEALSGAEDDHETDSESTCLLGSSVLPSVIAIGEKEVHLGDVVAAAHAESGLSVSEWNALPPEQIEDLLALRVEKLRQEEAIRATTETGKKDLEAEREAFEADKAKLAKERAELEKEKTNALEATKAEPDNQLVPAVEPILASDPGEPDADADPGVPPTAETPLDANEGQSEAVNEENEGGVS